MLVRQRFPNFVEIGGEIPIHKISSLEELQAIDFVERWMNQPCFVELQYASNQFSEFLMVITKEKFWAIASIKEGSLADFGLKEWVSPCT